MADKADGRIVIDTEIDVSGAKQGAKNLTSEQIKVRNEYRKTAREIALLQEQIKDMETPKVDTSSLEKYETKLQETYDKLADLEAQAKEIENEINASVPVGTSEERLQDMYEHNKAWKEIQQAADKAYIEAEKYEKEIEKIKATKSTEIGTLKYKKAVDSLANATEHLEALGKKTKEVDAKQTSLVNKLKSVGREGKKSFKKASNSAQKFAVRLRSIIASAFIFNVISSGLRSLTSYMGNALKRNKQFSDSVSAIKGNLLTAFQPVYDAVMPALNIFMTGLQKVTGYIASFMNMIFGTSIKASQESAKELYEQASALDSVSDSAKKANKQLSSIDELHVVNKSESIDNAYAGTGNNIVPSFGEIETIDELPEWLKKCLETIKKLIEDWKIGDFFSVGEDVSDLVIQINEFVANAISNVDWTELGKNVGAFLRGINWLEVLKSIGDVIGAAIDGAFDFWFGALSEAPFETALITAMALWKLTGVGSFLTGKINNALGTALPTEGFSFSSVLKMALKILIAYEIGSRVGYKLGSMLMETINPELEEFYKEFNSLGDIKNYVFKFGFVDGLKEIVENLPATMDEVFHNIVFGFSKDSINKVDAQLKEVQDKISNFASYVNTTLGNLDTEHNNILSLAQEYYELSQKTGLTQEDIDKLGEYRKALEEYGVNVESHIVPGTNAWAGTNEELLKAIDNTYLLLKINASSELLTEAYKNQSEALAEYNKLLEDTEQYSDIFSTISEEIEKGTINIDDLINYAEQGAGSLFDWKGTAAITASVKIPKSIQSASGFDYKTISKAANAYKQVNKAKDNYNMATKKAVELEGDLMVMQEEAGLITIETTDKAVDGYVNMSDGFTKVMNEMEGAEKETTSEMINDFQQYGGEIKSQLNKSKLGMVGFFADTAQNSSNATSNMTSDMNEYKENALSSSKDVKQGVSADAGNMSDAIDAFKTSANIAMRAIEKPIITVNTSLAEKAVTSGVSAINAGLELIKIPSINIETSTAQSEAEILRNNIETALSGINIGLEFQLQAKVNDAIAAGFNIGQAVKMKAGEIKAYRKNSVPHLASGAIIPPNKEFMAVLGDQRHGMNIEAPADLIKQMVKEGIAESGTAEDKEINVYVYLEGDAEGVFNMVKVENDKVRKQTGNSAFA